MARVEKLEKTLKNFRVEVDMKFKILQQILSNRNEQVVAQKELLEREHTLYKTLLGHWKHAPVLAANGLCLNFTSEDGENMEIEPQSNVEPDVSKLPEEYSTRLNNTGSTTRSKARARRARKRRRMGGPQEPDSGDDDVVEHVSDFEQSFEDKTTIDKEESDQKENTAAGQTSDVDETFEAGVLVDNNSDTEERIYVEYEDMAPEDEPLDPIWKDFLIDETFTTALCKLCDQSGIHKVLKVTQGSTLFLQNHLTMFHGEGGGKSTTSRSKTRGNPRASQCQPRPISSSGSTLWDYFSKEGLNAVCLTCQAAFARPNGCTTGLHRHLKKHNVAVQKIVQIGRKHSSASSTRVCRASVKNETVAKIWDYYSKVRNSSGFISCKCKLCEEEGVKTLLKLPRGRQTKDLRQHLEEEHDLDLELKKPKPDSPAYPGVDESATENAGG